MSFASKLKKFEQTWKGAEGDQAKPFERVPDDKYKAIVHGAIIGESKSSSRLQCAWDFRIIKGQHINKHAMAYDSLEDERGMAAIKGRLEVLGVTVPKSTSGLPEALDKACDRKCLIKLETRKGQKKGSDFQTLTVIKRLKKKAATAEAEEAAGTRGLDT